MTVASQWCSPGPEVPPVPSENALCRVPWRRVMLTGLFRDMLINHFANPRNIEEVDLLKLIWRDEPQTAILIESITKWAPETLGKRPAVIIKPNAAKNLRIGIGDWRGSDGRGHDLYTTFWVGSHTLFCLNLNGASVEVLAGEVQREMTQFGNKLVTHLKFLRKFAASDIGEIGVLDEAKENFVVPVIVGWAYEESWIVERESLPIRKISLSAILDV